MMIIENKFYIGQMVFLITDEDQRPRIISSFQVLPGGYLLYALSCGALNSNHYDIEISESKDELVKINS